MNLEKAWYAQSPWLILLRPVSLLFGFLSRRRRQRLSRVQQGPDEPVLIVGNISVGGSGKTPLIIELVRIATALGLRPGVISRGYGGQASNYPLVVNPSTPASESGDEPKLIVLKTGVPLVVDPDRVAAAQHLVTDFGVDLILSDDGLQHYRLKRDFEIAVVDGKRGLGNARLLPEGPLREPPSRLSEVDLVVVNGHADDRQYRGDSLSYQLQPDGLINLKTGECRDASPEALGSQQVNAIAGIGHPDRFFTLLTDLGFEVNGNALPDHAEIGQEQISLSQHCPLIMTEKDAVKCMDIASDHCWALAVTAQFSEQDRQRLIAVLQQLCKTETGEIHGS